MSTMSATLPEQMIEAGMKITSELHDMDPVERVDIAQQINQALLDLSAAVAQHRRTAVRELRRDYTQQQVGDMLGLSAARIQQIEHGYGRADKQRAAKGDALLRKWAGLEEK